MITILQEPAKITPGYNEQWLVAQTTNQAQDNFKFVIDIVFLGDVTYTRRIKRNIYPGTSNKLVVDVHRIIENYIGVDVDLATEGVTINGNSYKGYVLRIGEEYGSTPTVYPNLAQSNIVLAWNGVLDFEAFATYSSGDVVLGTTSTPMLTDAPLTQKIGTNENAWLYVIQNPAGTSFSQYEVKTYDSSNTLIDTYLITNPYVTPASSGECFLRFPVGTANLNIISSGDVTAGTLPIITANVAKYTVRCVNTAFPYGGSSVTRTYVVDAQCDKYDRFRLHWLNRKGGIDSFTFTKANKQAVDIARQTYKKPKGTLNGNSFGYSATDRLKTQYFVDVMDKYTINSDWLTDEESEWLEQLITSPLVWWERDSQLIPINITATSYESKKAVTDMTFNLVVDFELTYTNQMQRG